MNKGFSVLNILNHEICRRIRNNKIDVGCHLCDIRLIAGLVECRDAEGHLPVHDSEGDLVPAHAGVRVERSVVQTRAPQGISFARAEDVVDPQAPPATGAALCIPAICLQFQTRVLDRGRGTEAQNLR